MGVTGLFFGSFNPIHNGHLAIARYLLDEEYCRKVWFVVSPQNPWKKDQSLLDEQKRFWMVKEAIAGDNRMKACDQEFRMSRPSYTYQTLQTFSREFPGLQFSLIMGGDNLRNFHLWKDYEKIIALYPVLVYPRPGETVPVLQGVNITLVDAPLTSVSSTEIRDKVKIGKDVAGEVPDEILPWVLEYYK